MAVCWYCYSKTIAPRYADSTLCLYARLQSVVYDTCSALVWMDCVDPVELVLRSVLFGQQGNLSCMHSFSSCQSTLIVSDVSDDLQIGSYSEHITALVTNMVQ